MLDQTSRGKSALVLSGGGAFGAYEVGVIKALFDGCVPSTGGSRLEPDIFSGTSVGNFNAAVMAMNIGGGCASAERLHHLWTHEIADNNDGRGNGVYRIRTMPTAYLDLARAGSPREQMHRLVDTARIFTEYAAKRGLRFIASDDDIFERIAGLVDISALFDVSEFYNLVRKSISPETLRASGKVLRVTATGWNTGDAQEFDFPRMTDAETWSAIQASAAIPAVFPPVTLWGDIFIDGGVVMNTPIKPAVLAGATELHVVSLNPDIPQLPPTHVDNTFDTFNRVYAMMLTTMIAEDIESARWINEGIEALERIDAGEELTTPLGRQFTRVAGQIYNKLKADGTLYRKLTIHRYYPKEALGGMAEMLNFRRMAIDRLIDEGYKETLEHDCVLNNCVIPAVAPQRVTEIAEAAAA
ncbi:MAG TPA: patatin-like phospholipase family protein [Bryobacteraceae bacterium]|nr:patatin-like phospholipase family protein [Bryobacteraceae bacterium]